METAHRSLVQRTSERHNGSVVFMGGLRWVMVVGSRRSQRRPASITGNASGRQNRTRRLENCAGLGVKYPQLHVSLRRKLSIQAETSGDDVVWSTRSRASSRAPQASCSSARNNRHQVVSPWIAAHRTVIRSARFQQFNKVKVDRHQRVGRRTRQGAVRLPIEDPAHSAARASRHPLQTQCAILVSP